MLVSVVIGALNEENYVAKTLRTVKEQRTKHEIELIVGDGYSTDRTVEIAKSFGAKIAFEKNHSAAWERMAGAKIAKGDVIAFTDADALLPENWVEQIADEFEGDAGLAMLYSPVYFSDAPSFERSASKLVMAAFVSACAFIGFHNPIGSNIAVRRKTFEEAGGFNTNLVTAEDLDLGRRMARRGKLNYCRKIFVEVSARRIKKWGYPKFVFFHLVNALKFHLTGSPEKKYEPVR